MCFGASTNTISLSTLPAHLAVSCRTPTPGLVLLLVPNGLPLLPNYCASCHPLLPTPSSTCTCSPTCSPRYEDAYTNPGHPFACGISLDRISGYTVDEAGREAFVTNNPLQMLRKVCGGVGALAYGGSGSAGRWWA